MLIELIDGGVRILAPAKLNLHLEVLGKRDDGYHEIESLMCPISLCDTLEFRSTAAPNVRLEVQLPEEANEAADGKASPRAELGVNESASTRFVDPAWQVPDDASNLAHRAATCVREFLGVTNGCEIKLTKAIPSSAGLGGGSSDAAAAVVAAMLVWRCWDRAAATRICAELGSDLNVFLGDENCIGLTMASGRGEKCKVLPLCPQLEFIVTHPPVGCPTSAVYAKWRKTGDIRSADAIIAALATGDIKQIGPLLFNALENSARQVTPWIDNQLRSFLAFHFRYNAMTGSGSSCFALVSSTDKLSDMRRAAKDAGLSRVYAVKSWFQPSIEEQIRLISSR